MDMELLNAISEMLDKKLDERFEKNNEILRQEMKPVSYTHLDVYKRQIQSNGGRVRGL